MPRAPDLGRRDADRLAHQPEGRVPGTKMAFPGLKKPEDIANVIAFLKSYDETGAGGPQ